MDSPTPRPSLHECSHAEQEEPPSSGLAEKASIAVTEVTQEQAPEWKAGRQETLIMIALMAVSLIAALDTTVLITVLPVSKLKHPSI